MTVQLKNLLHFLAMTIHTVFLRNTIRHVFETLQRSNTNNKHVWCFMSTRKKGL